MSAMPLQYTREAQTPNANNFNPIWAYCVGQNEKQQRNSMWNQKQQMLHTVPPTIETPNDAPGSRFNSTLIRFGRPETNNNNNNDNNNNINDINSGDEYITKCQETATTLHYTLLRLLSKYQLAVHCLISSKPKQIIEQQKPRFSVQQ